MSTMGDEETREAAGEAFALYMCLSSSSVHNFLQIHCKESFIFLSYDIQGEGLRGGLFFNFSGYVHWSSIELTFFSISSLS